MAAAKASAGSIRVGIGGWSFPPWRETFYPPGTRATDELRHAAGVLPTIEINATFYRSQTPAVFAGWRATVPDGFVFSVKAPRGATVSADPERAAASIERFLASGVAELGPALGPILWQFPGTRRFDAAFFERFLALLPDALGGVPLRHAIEFRHPSGHDPAFGTLLEARGVALALVARPGEPSASVPGRGFAYVRIEETVDEEERGLPDAAIAAWAERLRALAAEGRDVFAYVIAGAKHRNPAAAQALLAALSEGAAPRSRSARAPRRG